MKWLWIGRIESAPQSPSPLPLELFVHFTHAGVMATPHYETIISAVKTLIDEGSVVTRGEAHDAMLRMTDELEK